MHTVAHENAESQVDVAATTARYHHAPHSARLVVREAELQQLDEEVALIVHLRVLDQPAKEPDIEPARMRPPSGLYDPPMERRLDIASLLRRHERVRAVQRAKVVLGWLQVAARDCAHDVEDGLRASAIALARAAYLVLRDGARKDIPVLCRCKPRFPDCNVGTW